MLFTRCPACETTFRITAEALRKAGGQVRCGRCATVFDAYSELREERTEEPGAAVVDPGGESGEAQQALAGAPGEQLRTHEPAEPEHAQPDAGDVHAAEPDAREPGREEWSADEQDEPRAVTSADERNIAGAITSADERNVAPGITGAAARGAAAAAAAATARDESSDARAPQIERAEESSGAHADTIDADIESLSPEQIDEVLDREHEFATLESTASWIPEPRAQSRWWSYAAALAFIVLGLQIVHHLRADLANRAIVGPILQQAYGMLGTTLVPRWDVHQYQILDWIATAEPNARGQGNLKITARIHNRGPQTQPYPQVHLQLKNRWEAVVGSRVFRSSEYLDAQQQRETMMKPGDTAQAQLEVVDPGPDAYGFELDVCVQIEVAVLRCSSDQIFK